MIGCMDPDQDPRTIAVVEAIRTADVDTLARLLHEHPELATARYGTGMSRTLLHAVTDWPGHLPNGAAMVATLVDAGADVNARFTGSHAETPLHWAASSDDVDVLDALLDAGADIEAPGAVIGGGTPLADATAFGQWNAARRLIERGAHSNLFESATLGLSDRIASFLEADPKPGAHDITAAFWGACHGGQLEAAVSLLERGADINWVSTWDQRTPLDAARRNEFVTVAEWLRARGAKTADELS